MTIETKPIAEITDGNTRLVAEQYPDGDVVFHVYNGTQLAAYIGLDLFTSVSKADFAEAVLRASTPQRFHPVPTANDPMPAIRSILGIRPEPEEHLTAETPNVLFEIASQLRIANQLAYIATFPDTDLARRIRTEVEAAL